MHEICMTRRPCPALRETIIALLNAGTGPRLVDNESATPLHHLYRFTESCTTVVCTLLGHGADVNASDDEGLTTAALLAEYRRAFTDETVESMSFSRFAQPTLQSKLTPVFETTVKAVTALLESWR